MPPPAGGDAIAYLRRVAVRERLVGVQVAVSLRVMRARARRASGTGTAGDAADEQSVEAGLRAADGHGREQRGRGKTARVPRMRLAGVGDMFRQALLERPEQGRRAVGLTVHARVVVGRGVAKVRRAVDDVHRDATGLGLRDDLRDQGCRCAVRCRREQRQFVDLVQKCEAVGRRAERHVGPGRCQRRERVAHGFAGPRCRNGGTDLEVRMQGEQAQQFATDEAGGAENGCRNASRHQCPPSAPASRSAT
ncbi:MAG: hypothetical protein U5K76_09535 [Woeseiaceae bacterium]|nr:hypothetical protein [Woeseiaceae bacterium]